MKIVKNSIKTILMLIMIIVSSSTHAQLKKNLKYSGWFFFDSYYFEGPVNFHVGPNVMLYNGDLSNGIFDLENNAISPGITLGASYQVLPRIFIGADFSYFKFNVTDAEDRGLDFTSSNMELTAYGKFNLIYDRIVKHGNMFDKPKLIKPYFKLGIGVLNYNPSVSVEASYPRYAFVLPGAFGFSFDFSHKTSLMIEYNYRMTFSDLLDDASAQADKGSNDSYSSFNIMLQYTPGGKRIKKKRVKASKRYIENNSSESGGSSPSPAPTSTTPTPEPNAVPEPTEEIEEAPEEEIYEEEIIEEESEEEEVDDYYDDEYYEEEDAEEEDSYDDGW